MVRADTELLQDRPGRVEYVAKQKFNLTMEPQELAILQSLDQAVWSPAIQTILQPIVNRIRAKLSNKRDSVMAWEPIPLTTFGDRLPTAIRSAWVFILRAGTNTGAERHPNSRQRMMSYLGTGDMQIRESDGAPWES